MNTTQQSELPGLKSASKFEEDEFLCLRAIWPRKRDNREFPFPKKTDLGLSDRAKEVCKAMKGLTTYLDRVRSPGSGFFGDPHSFRLAYDAQLEVLSMKGVNESDSVVVRRSARIRDRPAPAPTESQTQEGLDDGAGASQAPQRTMTTTPSVHTDAASQDPPFQGRTLDEEIVNIALMEFLRALTLSLEEGVLCRWSHARSPFGKAEFGDNNYVARTDGYLQSWKVSDVPDIFAIVEVKPRIRRRNKPAVYWQKTAEMVSWILHDYEEGNKTRDHK